MNKKILILALCIIAFGLSACKTEEKKESVIEIKESPVTPTETTDNITEEKSEEEIKESTDELTQEQCLEAVKKYCFSNNPDLEDMVNSNEYDISWDVTQNENNEIVVLYRSYTGAETRYYIDPISGETYVTELVPGIIDNEEQTDEHLDIKNYIE
ncbi:MAG: hypothetical protein K5931_09605 [Lachnospiraceae bacterium]|nr:hypothetical protein [Lachnospiraceae bacterium]